MLPKRNPSTPPSGRPAPTAASGRPAPSSAPKTSRPDGDEYDYLAEYEYAVRTPEDVARFEQTMEEERSFRTFTKRGLPTFRPHDGENQIRILPPLGVDWSDYLKYRSFGISISTHWGIGAEGGKKQTVLCLSRSRLFKPDGYGNRCPICEEKALLTSQGQKDAAQNLRYQDRTLVWVIDRKTRPEDPNPLLWGMPSTVLKNLLPLCVDRRTKESIFVEHPRDGRDFWFTYNPPNKAIGGKAAPKGSNTYVGYSIDPSPVALTRAELKEYLEFVKEHPLDQCLDWQTYDEINEAFQGGFAGTQRVEEELELEADGGPEYPSDITETF